MYVSIDRERLTVLHVHPVQDVVGGLLYLEGTKIKHGTVENTERPQFLTDFTSLELNLLYRNTTGHDFPPHLDDLARRTAIAKLVEGMTPRKVRLEELQAQCDLAADYLDGVNSEPHDFEYVFGAKRPKVDGGGLFPLKTSPIVNLQAATADTQRFAAPAAPLPAAAPAPRPTRQNSGPTRPAGGARPRIFAVADEMWEAVGKPTNPQAVLDLRKRIMAKLEEEGIKRTTSSTALGEWQKQKLA